jgi:methionyl-tRNA formyltransferase
MNFNVIYIGSSGRACDYIHCHMDFNVVAVICQKKMVNDELLKCCYLRGIPLYEIDTHKEIADVLEDNKGAFDFAIMYIFGIILKKDILDNFKVYNIHLGYLPFYKGRNSTFYATMDGKKEIGISLHEVTPGIDEGLIISRKLVPYYFWMGEIALRDAMVSQIPDLLNDMYNYLTDVNYKPLQNNRHNYYPPVQTSLLEINEDTPVKDIINITRSQETYAGARFKYKDVIYLITGVTISLLNTIDLETLQIANNVLLQKGRPIGMKIDNKYFLKFDNNADLVH